MVNAVYTVNSVTAVCRKIGVRTLFLGDHRAPTIDKAAGCLGRMHDGRAADRLYNRSADAALLQCSVHTAMV